MYIIKDNYADLFGQILCDILKVSYLKVWPVEIRLVEMVGSERTQNSP